MKNLRYVFLLVAAISFASLSLNAQVSINTDGTAPHTSAMLEVKSTNKGLLIPRMTTAQRTTLGASAIAGLMVYDADLNKFYYHNGSGWIEGSVGGYWTRSGSALYNTNTSDNIGIGTTSPGRRLEVFGGIWPFRLKTSAAGIGIEFISAEATDWGIMTWGNNLRFVTSTNEFSTLADEYYFDQNEFTPWTNGTKTVGSSSKRFSKLYFVDGNFSGNVGIGVTTPVAKLHVADGNNGSIRIGSHANWNAELSYTYGIGDFVIQSGNASTATGADIIFKTYGKNRAIVKGSGEVGIGTLVPLAKFHVHDSILSNTTLMITPGTTVSGDSSKIFMGEDANGSFGMYWMYDGLTNDMQLFGKSASTIYGPHLSIDRGTGNAAFGSTFATGYKLSVSGKIICEELRVDLVASWPDYVFDKDYSLLPVDQLGVYIEENGHLPNIPPAAEIDKSGLDIGNMQRLMMEKIEELSLYIIEQQKQIKELKDQMNELKNK